MTQLPPVEPPSVAVRTLAQRLFRDSLGDLATGACNEDNSILAPSEGWSNNTLVRIASTRGSWMVKLPRKLTPDSISACNSEGLRARWAGEHNLGPEVFKIDHQSGAFIMKMLDAQPLTSDGVLERLPEVMELLHRFHEQTPPKWLKPFNIFDLARRELARAIDQSTLSEHDADVIQEVLKRAESITSPGERWVACHNDFWSTNILSDKEGKLWCIDFELTGMGDPLWDIGYLAFELKTSPRNVALAYGIENNREQLKVVAYCHAAKAWLSCWCANRSDGWRAFLEDYLDRVHKAAAECQW